MKKLINFLISSIVDQPDKIKIELINNPQGFEEIKLSVAQEDMGKIIGKKGKIIKAIRNLVKVKSILSNKKTILTLQED